MKNYTQAEIQQMQQEAIARVRDMHRRSQQSLQNMNVSNETHGRTQNTAAGIETNRQTGNHPVANQGQQPGRGTTEAKHISMPIELPEKNRHNENTDEPPAQAASVPAAAPRRGLSLGGLFDRLSGTHSGDEKKSSFLNLDSDTALILALVLLLSGEGADTELIMALLYIMY